MLDPGMTIKQIMDTWTLQTGFPVVTVVRNYNKGSARLEQVRRNMFILHQHCILFYLINILLIQERFLLHNATIVTTSETEPLWWIPLTYTTEKELNFNNTKPSQWMRATKEITLSNLDLGPNQWIIFNLQETGKRYIFFEGLKLKTKFV